MYLKNLTFFNFKNYEEAHFAFSTGVNCLLGKNGVGKTNILDGIYYLGFTKSFLGSSDALHIRHAAHGFSIKGEFYVDQESSEVSCGFSQNTRKVIKVNSNDLNKLSDHIGEYPMVLIAPNDIEFIWGSSEPRRRFFDSLISQLDRVYLNNLMTYNHLLKQRNSFLRLADHGRLDMDLLQTYDHKLSETGTYIHKKRAEFLSAFLPTFEKRYSYISGEADEDVNIYYKSDCTGHDFLSLLTQSVDRDLALQRTTAGIHRDEFVFTIDGYELKKIGSQGQQKSFLIGMKLAEFQSIEQAKKKKPILLLDDIFDKLDDERIHKLVSLVADGTFGQLFITDARPDRSQKLLKEAGVDAEVFMIDNGKLTEVL